MAIGCDLVLKMYDKGHVMTQFKVGFRGCILMAILATPKLRTHPHKLSQDVLLTS